MNFFSNPNAIELLLTIAAVLILLFILSAFLRRLGNRSGDRRVAKQLARLDKNEYKILHDLFITSSGKYSHINHLVICKKGLIAVETYHCRGLITGTEGSVKWSQRTGTKETPFMNPIHQYYSDQRALEEALSGMNPRFYRVIVFTDTSNLDVQTKTRVLYTSQLFLHIDSLSDDDIFSSEQVDEIAGRLAKLDVKQKRKRRAHIRNIKNTAI